MSELNQPHDRFFSKMFSRMDIAEDILRNHVPALAELIVPGTLEQIGEKLVDEELERFYSDLLLKAKLFSGNDAYIYLLLEHKSQPVPKVVFDVLGYMMQIWKKIQEKNKPLPFLYPIVIYHGKIPWNAAKNFAELVEIPHGMDIFIPSFEYHLLDLSSIPDEEIKGTILSRVVMLLLKNIYADDFGERFISICGLLAELNEEKTALEFMRSVINYIANATDKITQDQVKEGIQKALPEQGEYEMPTLAEQWKEEGRQEGWQKGRQEGKQEGKQEGMLKGIQLALELKFGGEGLAFYRQIEQKASITNLDAIEEALRQNASIPDLEKLIQNFN